MCYSEVGDIYCRNRDCNNILLFKGHIEDFPCQIVIDNVKPFGWCGRKARVPCAEIVRSQTRVCDHCYEAAVREQNEMYQNLGQHVAQSRADQQRLDNERGARAEMRRQAAQLPNTEFEEYAAMLSSIGRQWSIGEEGDAHGASGGYAYPGVGVNEIPPEGELGMDETTGEGWNDSGEGSSRGYDKRYTHGGARGRNQRSRRY